MSGICWLASYPKSGNTWLRVFLANILSKTDRRLGINELEDIPIASDRQLFDEVVGIEASDLTHDEIERLRPEVYLHLGAHEMHYVKIHDAYTSMQGGPFHADSWRAVYIIRNPLDVAVSLANHLGCSFDESISRMSDVDHTFCGQKRHLPSQLPQRLLSWSEHVRSWVAAEDLTVHVVRYEDMSVRTHDTFMAIVRFLGLSVDEKKLERAFSASCFEELRRQECADGFKERPSKAERFFRKGHVGAWKTEMLPEQAERLIENHQEVMRQFGYLDAEGKIVY